VLHPGDFINLNDAAVVGPGWRRRQEGYLPPMTEDAGATREPMVREQGDRSQGKDPLRGSRTSGLWAATVGLAVLLVLLVVFIAQNTRRTTVSFLAWDGEVPVSVALLIAAVAGLFLAGLAGMLRILQLRRRVRRERR
jgi:uncharacterized integral membrane protein